MIYSLYLPSLLWGGIGAWIISKFAFRWGLMDRPSRRSSHWQPTPKGGGIGILVAFVFSSLFIEVPFIFWLPAAILALFSFFGDRLDISPKFRLAIQFLTALVFLFGIRQFHVSHLEIFLIIVPMAIFAVGTANIYNFMDGINGIAAITGVVGFGLLAFSILLLESEKLFPMLCICIALSCLGFLPFNLPKAKVFMGDVGSVLLGFAFSGMVVMFSKSLLDFFCLASFLFPFYADELTTMFVRIKDGENLFRAHRKHIYQILANEKGMAHWKVAGGYGFLQLVVGLTVLFLKPFGIIVIMPLLAIYFILSVFISVIIRRSVTSLA
jgi:Fuc2NAc and GlcNAc transferase